ncbi:phophatidylserine decarboxylase associated domain-containing protein [Streptomyces sp. NPDC057579]|uniref:phophatidylserine decarboxylase associated domain-containing protein n=1 Tax=Streptomyces sp. NPDC057579 TaxID=3346172 RepID=UPI00367E63CD
MSDDIPQATLEARYRHSFGRLAGYLPESRAAVDEWQAGLVQKVADYEEQFSPAVQALADLIERDGTVRQYVTEMIEQVPPTQRKVADIPQLLNCLNYITGTAPAYNPDKSKRIAFPMSALFVHMMGTKAGETAFRLQPFNNALRAILTEWCGYLDSQKSRSVLNRSDSGWLSPPAWKEFNLDEFIIPRPEQPDGGFASYNAFFHREIKEACRPVDPTPDAIVSPNDGQVWTYKQVTSPNDRFWLKAQPYSLTDMVQGRERAEPFVGGHVFQSFLSGADYHRWRSPVNGTVTDMKLVPGLMFSETVVPDKDAGVLSQGYEASVNTRGLVFIDSEFGKKVCVMPIGITEISSVVLRTDLIGETVRKGDELGMFSYGGSSMCVLFEKGLIKEFTVPNNDPIEHPWGGKPIRVNARIARANMP